MEGFLFARLTVQTNTEIYLAHRVLTTRSSQNPCLCFLRLAQQVLFRVQVFLATHLLMIPTPGFLGNRRLRLDKASRSDDLAIIGSRRDLLNSLLRLANEHLNTVNDGDYAEGGWPSSAE